MKKVINGKRYDTTSATKLAEYENTIDVRNHNRFEETLYEKKTGEYFLHGAGGAGSKYGVWFENSGSPGEKIMPLSLAEAKKWAEEYLDGDEYETIFGEVDESEEIAQSRQISILLPQRVFDSLKAKSASSRLSMAELSVRALREAGYGEE